MRIFILNKEAINVDNKDDAQNLLSSGARELTPQEIAAAGMTGYEHLVSPLNTVVTDDGSIIFTPPNSEQIEQEKREQRREQIKAELSALDLQAVRPLRAIAAGTATDADHAKLADLEAQAEKLRAELGVLGDK